MELKEFVSQSIVEIIEGITNAHLEFQMMIHK